MALRPSARTLRRRQRNKWRDFPLARVGRSLRGAIPSRRLAASLIAAELGALAETQREHIAATVMAFEEVEAVQRQSAAAIAMLDMQCGLILTQLHAMTLRAGNADMPMACATADDAPTPPTRH